MTGNRQTLAAGVRGSYERKIFSQLVLLVSVPLLILGGLSAISYYKEEKTRNDLVLEQASQNVGTQVENILNNLRSYYLSAMRNDEILWMERESMPYSKYIQLKQAQEILRGGTYLDDYVASYEFINLRHGWVLDNNGMYALNRTKNYDEVMGFLREQDASYRSVAWVNRTDRPAVENSARTMLLSGQLLVIKHSSAMNGTNSILVVRLNMDAIRAITDEWQSLGYEISILDVDGSPVCSTHAGLAGALSQNPPDPGVERYNLPGNWSRYRVAAHRTVRNGMTYYAAYDTSKDLLVSTGTMLIALFVLALTVAMLAFCRWSSAFLYRPLRELLDGVNQAFGKPQSGQDEFAYLSSGVNRLEKSRNDLQELVVLQRRQLKDQFLLHMVHSEISPEAIDSAMQEYRMTPCDCYQLMALDVNAETGATGPEREALALTVAQRLRERLAGEPFIDAVPISYELVMLVGGDDEAEVRRKCNRLSGQVTGLIREEFGHDSVVGVSLPIHSLSHVRTAYNEAMEALHSLPQDPGGQESGVVFYTAADMNYVKNGYDVLLEHEIRDAIIACNRRECRRLLECFLEKMESKKIGGYERQFYLQRLVTAILSAADNAGISVNRVLSGSREGVFDTIGKIYNNDKMLEFLYQEVAVPVMDLLAASRQDSSSELVKNVIALIKQTRGDITLNECAEQLNYHPSYIWKVLKAERDTNFTDLVNAEKLEMAKEMLLTTDLTVAEVAENLHYANVQNFIRFFNRAMGMTPGKYRREHQVAAAGRTSAQGKRQATGAKHEQ